ncbi:MAG: YerC/YecD family TrpR-related protein [Acidimicrobiia bacterium]|nr:YerC/YecD family TrpR-related protein [Acidimicrobiia bacterium]
MVMANEDWRNDETAALFDAVLVLETREEAAHFFRDLCTRRELEEMSQRWAVVRKLADGHPYREIAAETGVSTATIVRINQWLRHGTGGYQQMLDKLGIGQE